jgi:hypothetical protein
MFRRLSGAVVCAFALAAMTVPAAAHAADQPSSPGAVRFLKRTDPSFDRFTTQPSASFQSWMRSKFWRSEVFTPYFDNKTSWYGNGLVYLDLYAVYRGSATANAHPEWILRDRSGNPLYIPWGCDGSACPQYAGDVGDPNFRAWFIAQAKDAVAHGYKGIWLDDVNLEFQVGNGQGDHVDPIDPRTGAPMTAAAWRNYVAGFVEDIRRALPGVELLHNSIWYAGGDQRDRDPAVQRQIAAADYINIERGVNDAGLTGGNGEWSLNALLSYIDRLHAAGKGIVLDGGDSSPVGREYSLAAYYLVSAGRDAVGLGAMTPENWWSAYDGDLGTPNGDRTTWNGLLARSFSRGLALVNGPDNPTRTVALPSPMVDTSGRTVTSVTLPARSGAVLSAPAGTVATPLPGSTAATTATATASSASAASTAAPTSKPAKTTTPRTVRVRAVKVRAPKRHTRVILGRVAVHAAARVRLDVLRHAGGRGWVTVAHRSAHVSRGRFHATLKRLRAGRYEVHATPRAHGRPARTTPRAFRVRA